VFSFVSGLLFGCDQQGSFIGLAQLPEQTTGDDQIRFPHATGDNVLVCSNSNGDLACAVGNDVAFAVAPESDTDPGVIHLVNPVTVTQSQKSFRIVPSSDA